MNFPEIYAQNPNFTTGHTFRENRTYIYLVAGNSTRSCRGKGISTDRQMCTPLIMIQFIGSNGDLQI